MRAKTTYYFALLLAAAGMMAGFNACTEEPEPDPFVNDTGGGVGGGGIQIGGGNDDEEEEEEQTFRVTSFTYADEYGLPDDSQLTRLYYDTTGRLAGGNFYESHLRFNISFARSGEAQQIYAFNETGTSNMVIENFQFNAQGYVTSAEMTGAGLEGVLCTGHYDTEGHLLEWTETFLGYEIGSYIYTWDGDNLVELVATSSTSGNKETYEFSYAPSSQQNPTLGVPWFTDLWESYEINIMRYAGLLGTMSRDIPTSVSYTSTYPEEPDEFANLQASYNSDGSLSWIRMTSESGGEGGENTIFFGYDGNAPGQY